MNLLLLEDFQFHDSNTAIPNERQAQHLYRVLKVKDGEHVKVGRINGLIGTGTVYRQGSELRLKDLTFSTPPPATLPISIILGMPRPQMLKRIIQTIATMGVSELCFIQSSRVEKSFWQSPTATDESIRQHLILGLEQGVATQLPKVRKFTRFRPFVEDELENFAQGSLKYIAHPGSPIGAKEHTDSPMITLAVGPEGGFLDQEVQAFCERGFQAIHLGNRILKVETAIPVLLAKLYAYS